jgi:hypothetical protein
MDHMDLPAKHVPAFMDMVPLDAGVLLVRGTYDGKTVDVAQVRCP